MSGRARAGAAIAELPCASSATGAASWRIATAAGCVVVARLSDDGRWLELEAAPAPPGALDDVPPARLIERGARIEAPVRVVLDAQRNGAARLRAELPLDVDVPLAAELASAVAGLAEAVGPAPVTTALRCVADRDPATRQGPDVDDLARACTDAGFAVLARRPEMLAVDLGLADVAVRTRLAPGAAGGVRAWVEIDVLPAPPCPDRADALARFLLATAAAVRMVRPFTTPGLDTGAGGVAVGFEVRLARSACSGLIGHALGALHTATSLAAREVAVLARDAAIAIDFLALFRPLPRPNREP